MLGEAPPSLTWALEWWAAPAAALAPKNQVTQEEEKALTEGIAAQLYTLRDFLKTPSEIAVSLKRLKAVGYDAVQLSGLGPIPASELASMLEGEGLTVASTHEGTDRLLKGLPAVIDEYRLFGCRHVTIPSLPAEFRNAEGYPRFGRLASELGGKLAEAGLTLSYHNHSFEFERFQGKTGMELLFDNSDPALVKAEIDTYWVQHGGADPVAWISRMKGRMVIVHFKDMVIQEGKQVMAEVGEGNLNWPGIVQACQKAGVLWYAVEQDICQRDPFESLAISLRNLHEMGL